MTIVCGIDFSETSTSAVRAAAALARLRAEPLWLVHATESLQGQDEGAAELLSLQQAMVERKTRSLREQGLDANALVTVGVPDEVLLDAARQHSASWLVIGAFGHRRRSAPALGGHADRLAQQAQLPLLVVRDSAPFEAWTRGERALRILLGVDFSAETPAAAAWVAELARLGPCDVTAAHLYWPPAEWGRLGLSGVRDIAKPEPEVTRALRRELEFCRQALCDATRVELCVEPNLGSIGFHLAEIASSRQADLIAVGTRTRGRLRRWWEGSVSRATLEHAATSVACVPGSPLVAPIARARADSVLVATDFSEVGNAAVVFAYRQLQEGGTVHLVHVVDPAFGGSFEPHDIFESGPHGEAVARQLSGLVPERLAASVETELHVLSARDRVEAICQAAERLGASTICLGTHGRGTVSRAILGSIARGVLATSHRRVVLVRPAVS